VSETEGDKERREKVNSR
jgi:hypothetical protein